MSSSDWGVTADQLRHIQGNADGKSVMLRIESSSDSFQHAGRAKLIAVLNDEAAEVQPLGNHHKTEVMPLNKIKIHKSECIRSGININYTPPSDVQVETKPVENVFLVWSENMKGVWRNTHPRGWVTKIQQASKFPTLAQADVCAKQFENTPSGLCRDATGVTLEEAHDFLGKVLQEAMKTHQTKPKTPASAMQTSAGAPLSYDDIIKLLKDKSDKVAQLKTNVATAQQMLNTANEELAQEEAGMRDLFQKGQSISTGNTVKVDNPTKTVSFSSLMSTPNDADAIINKRTGLGRVPYIQNAITHVIGNIKWKQDALLTAVANFLKQSSNTKVAKTPEDAIRKALYRMTETVGRDINKMYYKLK